ncbi:sigma-54-dependent Fis family transcriptional regulator [Streptomyces malaysiensis]|uniref:Sigma 54 specific transcriptional regulator, fisfamily n=1 Tax=Streptomyces malaysiensis TaxID=92644 RepID=A0A7X5WZN1_STRMQ|nr:helix-turn-helix domain-containing protein [Streptomyces malaysiensis]NIY63902.1 sigma 54 specific transcriptional regulator, fisfamily [Streptomyces malaysiensis]
MTAVPEGTPLVQPSRVGAATTAELASLREHFIADPMGTDLSRLRPVIARSWRRSLACRVRPGSAALEEVTEPHVDEQLLICAEPVLTELERLCADTQGAVCLADSQGTLAVFRGEPSVMRWADRAFPTVGGRMSEDLIGTNSDGTALEEGTAVQVWGGEHFAEALQGTCCTSVPIRDPLRRSIRGVLSLMLPESVARRVDPRSILLTVQGAAAEVTSALAARLAAREQALMAEYLREVRKRGADAVVAMDDRTTIASRGALNLLEQSDYAVLAAYSRETERIDQTVERDLTIAPDRVLKLHARRVHLGDGATGGMVIRLRRAQPRTALPRGAGSRRRDAFDEILGDSLALRRALEAAGTACARRNPAYIVGEPGTGKGRLAEAIAARLADRTVVFDCSVGGIGRTFEVGDIDAELASGAAVVLRRVDACDEALRERLTDLLRVLEQPGVVLTMRKLNDDLLPLIGALRGIEVGMPSLRMRREDIPPLVTHFLARCAGTATRVSPRLLDALVAADWPGNVRQLRDVVESAASRSAASELRVDDLAEAHRSRLARSRLTRLEEAELHQIREALIEAGGNRLRAAAILGIGRSTLYRKIDMYTNRGFELELRPNE